MRLTAKVISRIFDPIIEIPLLLFLAVIYAYVNGMAWEFLFVLLLVDALLPFIFFLHLLRSREIHDWDISRRVERILIYGFTIVAHLVGVGLAYLMGHGRIAQVLIVFWFLALLFFILTLFWKVSVHAGVNAVLATFMVLVGGGSYWWIYLLLLPVGWARVSLGKHSLAEFLTGSVLGTLGLWSGFWILGIF